MRQAGITSSWQNKERILMTFRVCWHDGGCVVFCNDGTRMAFKGRRYDASEVSAIGTKSGIAKLPGAMWKRFS